MKLSDLLKQASSAVNTYANNVGGPGARLASGGLNMLQNSINKSSPGFKATTTTQSGVPVASDMRQAPTVPQNTPASARADLQGVDYYKNLAMNAETPEAKQAAIGWLDRQLGADTPTDIGDAQTDTGSEIDFSTPTSDVAYSMEKLNELYGTKSPEDLWALRQKLRLQESQASAGMLPEEEYMRFQGDGITDGVPRYNYDQKKAVNRATADIFSTQVSDLDKFMNDYAKGETAAGSSGGYSFGSNPALDVILGSGKFTKDQKASIIGSIQSGQNPNTVILTQARGLMQKPVATDVENLQTAYSTMQDIDSAMKQFYGKGGKSSYLKGNYEKVINKLGGIKDPELVDLAVQIQTALQEYRRATTGTAYSVQEGADIASVFPGITNGELLNNTIIKSRLNSMSNKIDRSYTDVLGADVYNSIKSSNNPSSTNETFEYGGHTYKKNPDGSATLVSFNQVGGGTNKAPKVVAGYDISSYATDPNHERSVAAIYQKTPPFKAASHIDNVIRQVAPKSKITGQMVATAANTYGVDPKMVYAIMLQDSSLGTAGMGARNNNPGNIGQYDNLGRPVAGYQTLQGGVNAVAKWLSKKKVPQGKTNYA